ncbi:hypothetical protein CYMTET_53258 [Cymbomonas tetramitiformis]|uniref:Uncharacterized protein n=1 Tax=Cymbomonas tetramitiformis TaxID=36881 RepID=A0AAE0BHL1_9CHLO|nr:hypothetical protein CYMTET_53258 [Cymbomonas tetramitiformis]
MAEHTCGHIQTRVTYSRLSSGGEDSEGETVMRLEDLVITKTPTTLHKVAVMPQIQLDKPWAAGYGKTESAWDVSAALIMKYDAYTLGHE